MIRNLFALLGVLALTGLAASQPPSAPRSQASPPDLRPAESSRSPDSPQAGTQEQEMTLQRAHQKKTMAIMRNVGTAMFSWLTDQMPSAAAARPGRYPQRATRAAGTGASPQPPEVNMRDYPLISSDRLREILVPTYLAQLEETDGWGNALEFYLDVNEPMAKHVMCIRSSGRDGLFSGDSYSVSAFDSNDFDEDIVWCNGFFAHWPSVAAEPPSPGPCPPATTAEPVHSKRVGMTRQVLLPEPGGSEGEDVSVAGVAEPEEPSSWGRARRRR